MNEARELGRVGSRKALYLFKFVDKLNVIRICLRFLSSEVQIQICKKISYNYNMDNIQERKG